MSKFIFIDGKNFAIRVGVQVGMLKTSDGISSGLVYATLSTLCRLRKKFPQHKFVFCWEGKDSRKHRQAIYPPYKADREEQIDHNSPAPTPKLDPIKEALQCAVRQIPALMKVLARLHMQQVTIDGLEADDVIAVLACAAVGCGSEAIVYSMDNDFWQLIHHGVQVIVDTDKKRDLSCVTPEDIDKKYACSPENLLAMRCMLGDGSDNITNPIRGIGPAKAKKFFEAGLDVAASFDDQPHPVKALVQNAENMEAINVRHKVMRLPTTLTELQFTQAAHAATALAAMYIGQTSSSVVYPELKKVLEEFEIINVDRQLALAVFCPKI